MKIAAPHPTIMPSTFTILAETMGFFKKEKLEVELLWTAGGADAQQATINGSVDLAVQTGLGGVLAAIQRGAPIAIVGADMTGASDLFWYTRADKPFKSLADLGPTNTVSFSRPGASSETVVTLADRALQVEGPRHAVGQPARDADPGDVRPDRRRLGHRAAAPRRSPRARCASSPAATTAQARRRSPRACTPSTPTTSPRTRSAVKAFLRGYDKTIDAVYKDPQALDEGRRAAQDHAGRCQADPGRLLPAQGLQHRQDRRSRRLRSRRPSPTSS